LHSGGHKDIMNVYVKNKNGKPLMPCKPAKARKLLRDGKAKVVSHSPFTIQLPSLDPDKHDASFMICLLHTSAL